MKTILITGQFCVGKDLVADIISDFEIETNKILSYTTREPRYDGENTHLFCTKEEFSLFDDLVAQTTIGGEEYGARLSQFKEDALNLYVVDNKGVYDVFNNGILTGDIYVVEVLRPFSLRNCPKSRLNRSRSFDNNLIPIDYVIVNRFREKDKLILKCKECINQILGF